MDLQKRKKLEAAGWTVGNGNEFVGLTPEESELVELRLALSRQIRCLRQDRNMTQKALAAQMGSSQSRIAKVELGDPSVSTDLMFRTAFALGTTRESLLVTLMGS